MDKIDISLGGNPNDNYTKLQDILIKLKEKHLPNKTIKFNNLINFNNLKTGYISC